MQGNSFSLNVLTPARVQKSLPLIAEAIQKLEARIEGKTQVPVNLAEWKRLEEIARYLEGRIRRMNEKVTRWEQADGVREGKAQMLEARWGQERESARAFLMKHLPEILKQMEALAPESWEALEYRAALEPLLKELAKATFWVWLEANQVGTMQDVDVMREVERLGPFGIEISGNLLIGEIMEAFVQDIEYRGGFMPLGAEQRQ